MDDVTADVAQQKRCNNKYYASYFTYIYIGKNITYDRPTYLIYSVTIFEFLLKS